MATAQGQQKPERFEEDKGRVYDIIKSIEEVDATRGGMTYDLFLKEENAREQIAFQVREIGLAAMELSEDFKTQYGDIDWDVLSNLRYATYEQEIEVDSHALWYIIENDLPGIKDQLMDISLNMEDQEDKDTFVW